MTGQQEEAEDMLQESFSYAFSKLGSFRFESSFGAWLKRIVVNTCINHLKKRRVDLVFTETHNDPPPADNESVDYAEIKFQVEQVNRAVDSPARLIMEKDLCFQRLLMANLSLCLFM